ncbi:hypothetical protein CAPTEDRAFT_157611 [Capitella teleta]|uniref:Major facilitator superfamily (MFS) profile domain-containing protein n=1 Tax=Capitella teleta TaxID=283909 RepID=R7TN78_CAPTE|nr:hypothetical protein CAPTEDRAFT_157611 [Capitella teleta]|eukprot:ELT95099.1 hypothetical protein CAPTEDRAFT_157611 [Capitella teleta]
MKFTDSGFAWIVAAMSFLVLYTVAANVLALGVILPDLLAYFQVSQAMLGVLGSVKIFVNDIASGTLTGPLEKRLGCRPLAMAGLAFSAVGCVAAAFATEFYLFLVMFSILPGLGLAGVYIPCTVIVHQYHNKRRAVASSLASVGLSFATFTFPVIMRLTIQSFGWRASLVMLAAIHVQMVAAAMIFMPNPDLKVKPTLIPPFKKETSELPLAEKNNLQELNAPEPEESSESKKNACNVNCAIFKNPAFIFFLFAYPFADCGSIIYVSFALQRAVYQGINPVYASIILSVYGICSIVGRILSGFIANFKCTRVDFQVAGCIFAAGVICGSSFFAGSSLLLHSVFAGTFGFMNGAQQSVHSTLLVDIIGVGELARGMGIVQMVKCAMAAISLPIAGYLFDVTRNYMASYLVAGAGLITSSILYACSGIANERRKRKMSSVLE